MTESLAAYAAAHPPRRAGTGSWVEQLDEFPEILAAWKKGVPGITIRRWLIAEKGHAPDVANANTVDRRLREKFPRG